jgi:hypothetical protein
MNGPCGPWPARAGTQGIVMPETLGMWLQAQRLARGWAVNEMGRQLHRAAKAAGDNTLPSVAILASYVRRWERGKIGLTERYRLLYCAALAISPDEFGPGYARPPGQQDSPSSMNDGDLRAGVPVAGLGDAGCVVVVIPRCQQLVITISGAGASAAAESGTPRHPVIVKDPTPQPARSADHDSGPGPGTAPLLWFPFGDPPRPCRPGDGTQEH